MSAQKIAVICAIPPHRNTGMVTVDLAAHRVLLSMLPKDAQVNFYIYGDLADCAYSAEELPFSYRSITDHFEDYLSSDAFIFWGDFVHSRAYLVYDKLAYVQGAEEKTVWEAEYAKYCKAIFLEDLPQERLNRVMVFGSTIITNDAQDEIDATYRSHFMRFFSAAGAVYFRDALSAARISPVRGENPTLVCDCALLLDDEDRAHLKGFKKAQKQDGIGVFIGRSRARFVQLLFTRILGVALGRKCTWLPWLSKGRGMRAMACVFGYDAAHDHLPPGEILSMLSGYSLVITDTYHICVNAWNLGIPAICIGEGAGSSVNSVSDKKKEILYEMYGAGMFYVFVERICSPVGFFREIKRLRQYVDDVQLRRQIISNINDHKTMARQRLALGIEKILERK